MDGLSVLAAARELGVADRVALIAGGETLSYAALASRVASVASALSARKIGPLSRVALLSRNSVEAVTVVLAAIELGATLVPIHPRLTEIEATALLAAAAPDLVIREGDLPALPPVPVPVPVPVPDLLPLAMIFTSGTTGRPKGAILSRRAFLAAAAASEANLGFLDADRWLLCMPLCHVGGLSILTRCLIARRAVILEPRFDPDAVLASITRHRATLLSVVPTMLEALLERDRSGALAALRAVLVGGAPAPFALLEACAERGVHALTTYGLTEACSQITAQRPRAAPRAERGSGAPLPGAEIRIAGGRILVRGPMLMTGYDRGRDRPPDPSVDADGWLDTGDLGEIDPEGALHVHARRTDLIVTGGENVYPVEIEQCLEALPGVRRALVFGADDPRWGQVVAAAIELDRAIDDRIIQDHVVTRLAPHKRPRRVCTVTALPLTGSGKLDRGGAAARYAEALRPLGG